jgi:uncharacterized protein
MSRDFPEVVDLWRMVERRRGFSGTWPLSRCARLRPSLESDEGEVRFEIDFAADELGVRYADIRIDAKLILQCQRTLEAFEFQVERQTRLGLIEKEEDEPALPAGYEPYIVPPEPIHLVDLVEDELILALPVVALGPDEPVNASFGPPGGNEEEFEQASPFAVLAGLKTENFEK